MDFFDCYSDFLVYIDAKGHSPCTVSAYKSDANTFRKFLSDKGFKPNLLEIDHKVIRKYIIWLKEKGYANNSMKKKLDSLSSFYNYVEAEEIISHNPIKRSTVSRNKRSAVLSLLRKKSVVCFTWLTTGRLLAKSEIRHFLGSSSLLD